MADDESDDGTGLDGLGVFELTEAEIKDYVQESEEIAREEAGGVDEENEGLLASRRQHESAVTEPTRVRPVKTKWQNKFKTPASLQGVSSTGGLYHFHDLKNAGGRRANAAKRMAESYRNGTHPSIAKSVDPQKLSDCIEWRLQIDRRLLDSDGWHQSMPNKMHGALRVSERDRPSMAFRATKRKPLWHDPTRLSRSERARMAAKEPVVERHFRKRNVLKSELVKSKSQDRMQSHSNSTPNLHSHNANFQSEVPRFKSVDSMNDLFWRQSGLT